MKLPRWIRRLNARRARKFWIDCPICGEYFGGHEKWAYDKYWVDRSGLSMSGRRAICPDCARKQARK